MQYRIGFSPDENFYTVQDAIVLNVGKDTVVSFKAYKSHVLKARLQVKNNTNPPVNISTLRYVGKVWGTNNDTTVYMKIIPNILNEIQFSIINVDTPSLHNYIMVPVDMPGFQDTFSITIPLSPRLFPKRG